ncbi:MAG: glucosamine-6-phosphate deaminase [Verrucomicrobiia bacterium]
MEVIILLGEKDVGYAAAKRIGKVITSRTEPVLGLATGGSPTGTYRELVRMHQQEGLDFSRVRTFNLDEYLGLDPSHPASYCHFMRTNLFDHVNLRPRSAVVPSGMVVGQEIESYCEKYEEEIRQAGGIDLQLLGIGSDGHIGFNEPGSSLTSRTRIKNLTKRTREDNARYFSNPDEIPHHVITMGIGTIMEAREIVLIAFGKAKAAAIAAAVEGPITTSCPASILQMHPNAKVIVDEAAASLLQRAEYYRWVFDNKPDWQKDR